jgi:hypothetical protein
VSGTPPSTPAPTCRARCAAWRLPGRAAWATTSWSRRSASTPSFGPGTTEDAAAADPGRPRGADRHRRDLRRPEGLCEAERWRALRAAAWVPAWAAGGPARPRPGRFTWWVRRLAGRRGAGAGRPARPGAVHRRARRRCLDAAAGRARHAGCLQPHRPARAADMGARCWRPPWPRSTEPRLPGWTRPLCWPRAWRRGPTCRCGCHASRRACTRWTSRRRWPAAWFAGPGRHPARHRSLGCQRPAACAGIGPARPGGGPDGRARSRVAGRLAHAA